MNQRELADKYNDWLKAHCTPVRTASDSISKSRGLIRYEMPDQMPRLLGGSFVAPAEGVRKGEDVPANVRRAVTEMVEAWEIPAILQLRRDQKLAQDLRQALSLHKECGTAPDGSSIEAWARKVRRRYDRDYSAEGVPLGGEAARLWREIFPERLPAANRRRRERYAQRDAA